MATNNINDNIHIDELDGFGLVDEVVEVPGLKGGAMDAPRGERGREPRKGRRDLTKLYGERILAQDRLVPNNTWVSRLNNNDLIIGSTGSGKTRYYVKPNLLQMNESVIVTDTKGSLRSEVGPVLAANGYRVLSLDFTDMSAGIGYNPLDFVRIDPATGYPSERDIMRIATMLCPIETSKDPFWDYAARTYVAMLIGYVLEFLPKREQTLTTVVELIGGLQPQGKDYPLGTTSALLDRVDQAHPHSFSARKWRSIRQNATAEKMHASILGIVSEKLDSLTFDDTAAMFSKRDRIDFVGLGKRKTALFLTVSDVDRSMDRIVTLLYTQALQQLCEYADKKCKYHALYVPVRLYLDDFATNCAIPDFDKIISVIRSRNISVSVVLQSITQLDTIYGHAQAMTIVNGCDHLLYLGGQDIETAKFIGLKAGKTVDTILQQDLGTVWLFERGKRGEVVELYDLKRHRRYRELPEAVRGRPRDRDRVG